MALPSTQTYAGANLPAGATISYWLLFQFPTLNNATGFTLKQYMFFEHGYGGVYEGTKSV
jgi:hypothetical protein